MHPLSERGKILVAEDRFVRAFVLTYLTRQGFSVVSLDVGEAEEQIQAGTVEFDLLITNRPAQFAELAGRVPLLYLAASPDPAETAGFTRCHVLRKPFRPEQLLTAVTSLLGDGSAG
jgi:DNA-binding response OmpR family regulator